MSLETWMAYALASVVLLVITGPTILTFTLVKTAGGLYLIYLGIGMLQLWLLAVTFVVLATINAALYAVFAAAARRALSAPVAWRRYDVVGGPLLTGAGVWALLARRAAPGA